MALSLTIHPGQCYPVELRFLDGATGPGSGTWPTANLAIYVPLLIRRQCTVVQLFWVNGTNTGSPTIDAALYNEGLTRLYAVGGVTQGASGTVQATTISGGLNLAPGRYWMGTVMGVNNSQIKRYTNTAGVGGIQKAIGCQQQALGSTLMPVTPVFAAAANQFIPSTGLYLASLTI